MEKLLTVIVPSYNMEKYLARALDSLLVKDTHLFSLLDVIVVNDGSKDRTSEIAHDYAEKYPDVIRVIDKENGHYGSCVNVGVKAARGRFVRILDADDLFDTGILGKLLQKMRVLPDDTDAVLTDVIEMNEGESVGLTRRHPFGDGQEISVQDLLAKKCVLIMQAEITMRTALLHKIAYCQTEGIAHSDMEWTCLPIACSERIVSIQAGVYRYVTGRDGQSIDPKIERKNFWMKDQMLKNELRTYRAWREKLGARSEWLMRQAQSLTVVLFQKHLAYGYTKKDDIFWNALGECLQDMPWVRSILSERVLFARTPFRWYYCMTIAEHRNLRSCIFKFVDIYLFARKFFSTL